MHNNLIDGAYGSGKTGGDFDIFDYVRKPRTWIRLLCVAFGLLAAIVEGKTTDDAGECLFGPPGRTCSILKFTSLTALLIAVLLVVADVIFNRITSINKRKKLIIAECGVSAYLLASNFLLFFVCIIIWAGVEVKQNTKTGPANGSLFLLFINTLLWSCSLFFSYETYKEGMQINFSTGYINPDEMISESYPPISQQTRAELYDENGEGASYQDKEQLLRFEEDGHE